MIISRRDWRSSREKLESLFLASFGRPLPPGYLDWRYFDNNQEQLWFSIEMDNFDPVASYSAFPVDLVVDGTTCRTAMSMTTMTHPNWRGKGLFPKLARELYTEMETAGISAVWGFPNVNSHPQFNGKLGWRDIYEIPTMTLDLAKMGESRFSADAAVGEIGRAHV